MGGIPEAVAFDPSTGHPLGLLATIAGAGPAYQVMPNFDLTKPSQENTPWTKDWVLLLRRKQP